MDCCWEPNWLLLFRLHRIYLWDGAERLTAPHLLLLAAKPEGVLDSEIRAIQSGLHHSCCNNVVRREHHGLEDFAGHGAPTLKAKSCRCWRSPLDYKGQEVCGKVEFINWRGDKGNNELFQLAGAGRVESTN